MTIKFVFTDDTTRACYIDGQLDERVTLLRNDDYGGWGWSIDIYDGTRRRPGENRVSEHEGNLTECKEHLRFWSLLLLPPVMCRPHPIPSMAPLTRI